MRIPVNGNLPSFEAPIWPRLNVLDSPQLQHAVTSANDLLPTQPPEEREKYIHAIRPKIRQFLPGHVEGMGFTFKGYGWPSDTTKGHKFVLDDAEFAGICTRKMSGSFRIFFSLSAVQYSPTAETDDDPWHIDIDPLEPGNQLFENNSPKVVAGKILESLQFLADCAKVMTKSPDFLTRPAAAQRLLMNDLEDRCEEVCTTPILLTEYDITLRSIGHFYELRHNRTYAVKDQDSIPPALGRYTGILYLERLEHDVIYQLPLEKPFVHFPYGGAPCLEFVTKDAEQVRYYPLLSLADIRIEEYRSLTESIPVREYPNK